MTTTERDALWPFHGGLHLANHKAPSMHEQVVPTRLPRTLTLPLQQHIGEPAEALVAIGESVLKGQLIARARGYVSAPVHASSSGTVIAIEPRPVPHPSGLSAPCIVIETDGREQWRYRKPRTEGYATLDPSALRNLIREAGIVGLGGAGFPSFIKLNPGTHTVDTLVLNGAECEPYITCDAMLMIERPREIIEGLCIMRHALHARRCLIGIEDNKPDAIAALRETLAQSGESDIDIIAVPTRYPAGGEKQLIKVLTGKEVPSQGLPLDIGVVCHNVATAAAIYRAVMHSEPLLSRYVTVTGSAVARPRNLEVLIGTSIADILDECGFEAEYLDRLLIGGPMMGFVITNRDVSVIKTTHCLLATRDRDLITKQPGGRNIMPCIRCGECMWVCPVDLLPQQLYWYARARELERIQDHHLFDCIECGCCAHVCPSHLPLVQYYRFAKTEIWTREYEQQKADLARQRHAFRRQRQDREQTERTARHQQKRAALTRQDTGRGPSTNDDKKAIIEAAMARTRAKREGAGGVANTTRDPGPAQPHPTDEAEARRTRQSDTPPPITPDKG